MKNLEALIMVGCGLVGDEGLHFLGNGCPSLKVYTFLSRFVITIYELVFGLG